jgi:hypothetical protein
MRSDSTMTRNIKRARRAALLVSASAAMLLAGTTACNDFLTATNPGAVEEPDVNVAANADILTNGAITTYQFGHSEITYWNAQLTDELFNRATFAEEGEIDRRNLFSDMTYINAFMYGPAQRARYAGDDAAARLKVILGDTASRDLRLARSLAYAGHSYIDLGEMMCTTPIDLGVPKYSQEIHHGDFPQYDNGGEAWCSPTSTSMVVSYWSQKTGTNYDPTPAEYSWVTDALGLSHVDPWVDYTARAVYDYHYNGAGNWPFNAAYAASRGLVGDVTALHSLSEAEPYIRAGVPLVASVAWEPNKLEGAIKSTNGHLMVIGGFTANGTKVIAYDPASDNDSLVRHEYDREQFEKAWIPASGGIVYVIRPASINLDSLLKTNNS